MEPVIEIKHLGKRYDAGHGSPYLTLRDSVTQTYKRIFRGNKPAQQFWALDDIDLRIEAGERIGIIGRNGAGKSTLLKILSRITLPTRGEAVIRGRLAALLEVGTGFHPELTGRENIFLNGSILGLKKAEIIGKFDEIVNFSGVEKFLDMPVKNYSSGMQVRLAFAVAAHLEPDILLIDEVLAVGDMEFQQKCLGKMDEVSKQHGRTIVFVSHNMSYVSSLCKRAVLLDKGRVAMDGATSDVIRQYIEQVNGRADGDNNPGSRLGDDIAQLLGLRTIDKQGNLKENFSVAETIGIEMKYEVMKGGHVIWLGHNINNEQGVNVFDTHSVNSPYYFKPHAPGIYVAVTWIPAHLLNTGSYILGSAAFNHRERATHFHEPNLAIFTVSEAFNEITARGQSDGDFPGIVRPLLDWTIKPIQE